MPYRYSSEFRRKVLDLLAAGRSVASIAADLGNRQLNAKRIEVTSEDSVCALTTETSTPPASGSVVRFL